MAPEAQREALRRKRAAFCLTVSGFRYGFEVADSEGTGVNVGKDNLIVTSVRSRTKAISVMVRVGRGLSDSEDARDLRCEFSG